MQETQKLTVGELFDQSIRKEREEKEQLKVEPKKHFVDVEFKYKDIAKKLGAKFDGDKKQWYVTENVVQFVKDFTKLQIQQEMKPFYKK